MFVFFFSLEPLFFQYGVDIIIEAHEHSYERLWPVFNDTVTAHNYSNPKAPVHLISGAAGCNEAYGICVNPMLGPRGMQYFISRYKWVCFPWLWISKSRAVYVALLPFKKIEGRRAKSS